MLVMAAAASMNGWLGTPFSESSSASHLAIASFRSNGIVPDRYPDARRRCAIGRVKILQVPKDEPEEMNHQGV